MTYYVSTQRCRRCGERGHNARGCKRQPRTNETALRFVQRTAAEALGRQGEERMRLQLRSILRFLLAWHHLDGAPKGAR